MKEESPNEKLQRILKEAGNDKKRQRKYRNEPYVDSDGTRYDSQAEYRYKCKLDMLVRAKEILSFDFHVPMPLIVGNGFIIGHIVVDFIAVSYTHLTLPTKA